jgi:predicted transcriptional regulator
MTVRNTDPDTSAVAAALIEEHISTLQAIILRHLKMYPKGLTTRELTYHSGIEFATVTPRMRPMAEKGWVLMTSAKAKSPYGKGWGHVWIITPKGEGVIA